MGNEEQYRWMIAGIIDKLDEPMLRKVWTYSKAKLERLEKGKDDNHGDTGGTISGDHSAGDMYTANNTMRLIGKSIADDETHRSAGEILQGMRMPMTSDNIMLAVNAIIYGRIIGQRQGTAASEDLRDLLDKAAQIPPERHDIIKYVHTIVDDILKEL